MATSGTYSFTVTRDEIIDAALRLLTVIGSGQTAETEDYANCSEALNIMLKSWVKKGFPLWVYERIAVPMLSGLGVYPIGPTAGYIYRVDITNGGTGYPNSGTVTFTGGGLGATGTYTASGGVIQSVTITNGGNSYTSAPTVTFSGGGTNAAGTAIVAGLTMSRPLRIIDGYIRNTENFDTTLFAISQQEYNILGNKSSAGVPTQYYYDTQLINGLMYVYNVPAADGSVIYITVQRQFQDMSEGTQNFDFPQEWFQALKWNLANELSEEYEVAENKIMRIQARAEMYLNDCMDFSQEEAGVFFTPDHRGTIRTQW